MQLVRAAILSVLAAGCVSNAAHRIQYIPGPQTPEEDQPDLPPAPTDLVVTGQAGFNAVRLTLPAFEAFDTVQVYSSITNNRPDAVKVGEGRQAEFRHEVGAFSRRFYWARTRRFSEEGGEDSFSDWFPASATAGVVAGSVDGITDLAPDRHFALAMLGSYWYSLDSAGTPVSISLTGGTIAGRAIFVVDGQQHDLISRRQPSVQAITGQLWTVSMRWRRTATITGDLYFFATLIRHDQDSTSSTFTTAGTMLVPGGITLSVAEMNARTLNAWQEDTGTALVTLDTLFIPGELPYVSVIARTLQQLTGGGIEVDLLNATPGAGLIQQKRTYTVGATLSFYDTMKVIRYDSSSGGTLTLPNPVPQLDGAVIDFEQLGTGLLTIGDPVIGTLVSSPNTTGNRALAGRYASARATCRGADAVWILTGDLS